MDIDKRNLNIIERLEELRDLMKIGMDKITLQDAIDMIERLREALWDLEQYVSRADHFYLKPETLAALKEGE